MFNILKLYHKNIWSWFSLQNLLLKRKVITFSIILLFTHRHIEDRICFEYYKYLDVVHFQTIYFAQLDLPELEKKFVGCLGCRIMTPIDKTPFIFRFFRHFTQFSIGLPYKDVTQSDCTQRRDVTVSSETFGGFRNVFGKF